MCVTYPISLEELPLLDGFDVRHAFLGSRGVISLKVVGPWPVFTEVPVALGVCLPAAHGVVGSL